MASTSYASETDDEVLSLISQSVQENERYKLCKTEARSRCKKIQEEFNNNKERRIKLYGKFLQDENTAKLIYEDIHKILEAENEMKKHNTYLREVEVMPAKENTTNQIAVLEFSSGDGLETVKHHLDEYINYGRGLKGMLNGINGSVKRLPVWAIHLERREKQKTKLGRSYGPMIDATVMFPHMFEIGNTVYDSQRRAQTFYARQRFESIKAEFSVTTMSLKIYFRRIVGVQVEAYMLEILIKSVVGYAYKTERDLDGKIQDVIILKLSRPPFSHHGKEKDGKDTISYYCGEDHTSKRIIYERGTEIFPESKCLGKSFTYCFFFQRDDKEDQQEFHQMISDLEELNWYSDRKQKYWERKNKIIFSKYEPDRAKQTHQTVEQLLQGLDYKIAYYMMGLVERGLVVEEDLDPSLNPQSMLVLIQNYLGRDPATTGKSRIKEFIIHVLEDMNAAPQAQNDPSGMLRMKIDRLKSSPTVGFVRNSWIDNNDDNKCYIAKVLVTPTRIIPRVMHVELTNRVVRKYSNYKDRFARAQFVDENEDMINGFDNKEDIKNRIQQVIEQGFKIGSLRFEWLHYSNSGLRQHSAWFFSPVVSEKGTLLTPEEIRGRLGDFSAINNVPKYAARLGQCFSTTVSTADLWPDFYLQQIDDVKSEINGRPYTDGCGIISEIVLNEIQQKHPNVDSNAVLKPCAFQIRYAGFKGMVCYKPGLVGRKLRVRHSMKKFNSQDHILEVCQVSQTMTAFLNRQIIILLRSLGVGNAAFQILQDKIITKLKKVFKDRGEAQSLLRIYINNYRTEMTQCILKLIKDGFSLDDPFISGTLEAIRLYHLKDMKKKARIYVEDGVRLLGVSDEFGKLENNEVFIQIQKEDDISPRILEGQVLITRNPCLYPGDIRIANAVDRTDKCPGLKKLVNVLVFNTKQTGVLVKYKDVDNRAQGQGQEDKEYSPEMRVPFQHMCAGGDLDGDDYFVTWDASLFPPLESQNQASLEYMDATPKVHSNITARDCQQHFLGFMSNCNIGVISNAHLVIADKHLQGEQTLGANCPQCVVLALEADKAVNYGKYGQEAVLPNDLKPQNYPHYMEKFDKPSYNSTSILGKLYDQLQKDAQGLVNKAFRQADYSARKIQADQSLILSDIPEFEEYITEARKLRDEFNLDVWTVMCRYAIYSEQQLWTGVFLNLGNKTDKQTDSSLEQRITEEMAAIFKKYKEIFYIEFACGSCLCQSQKVLKIYVKASAWYACVYDVGLRGQVKKVGQGDVILLGFAYIPYVQLCYMKKNQDLSLPC